MGAAVASRPHRVLRLHPRPPDRIRRRADRARSLPALTARRWVTPPPRPVTDQLRWVREQRRPVAAPLRSAQAVTTEDAPTWLPWERPTRHDNLSTLPQEQAARTRSI